MSDVAPDATPKAKPLSVIHKIKTARLQQELMSSSITAEDVKELLREHGNYTKGQVKLHHVHALLQARHKGKPVIEDVEDKKSDSYQALTIALELAGYIKDTHTPAAKPPAKKSKKEKSK